MSDLGLGRAAASSRTLDAVYSRYLAAALPLVARRVAGSGRRPN